MSGGQILTYIEENAELYPIFKIIAKMRYVSSEAPESFETSDLLIETLTRIFAEEEIHNNVDERLKDVELKGLRVLGYNVGEPGSSEFAALILCKYLAELSELLFEKYRIVVTGCTFGIDSSCYLVIGVSKDEAEIEEDEDIDDLRLTLIGNIKKRLEKLINKTFKGVDTPIYN